MRYRNSVTGVTVSCDDDTITAMGPGWAPVDGEATTDAGQTAPVSEDAERFTTGDGMKLSTDDQSSDESDESEPESEPELEKPARRGRTSK